MSDNQYHYGYEEDATVPIFGHNSVSALGVGEEFGNPSYRPSPNQDANFPFQYDAAMDVYIGYRWDHEQQPGKGMCNDGPMRPPLTQELLATLPLLYLTNHPSHYMAGHLPNTKARLTTVYFKKPDYMTNYNALPFNGLWDTKYPEKDNGVAESTLTEVALKLQRLGIDGHVFLHSQGDPELALLNPSKYVVGANWREIEDVQNAFMASSLVNSTYTAMNQFFSKDISERFIGNLGF